MDLGVRQIRTAGKGSGSVELTLPGELRHLVGLPCHITLHDGLRPDIVLQPDLSRALAAFASLWRALGAALSGSTDECETAVFPQAAFTFGLKSLQGTPGAPYLSWQDGLSLAGSAADATALARSIAACAAQHAADIDIGADLETGFGAVCGFLAGGVMSFLDWQEACDIAASELSPHCLWQPGAAWQQAPCTASDEFWAALAPGLQAATRLFAAWSRPGSAYPTLRAAWRRGRSIELNRG